MKKQISTERTAANIQKTLQLLRETPQKLKVLSKGLAEQQFRQPLGPGERSFTETLAHLLHCEALASQGIYLALLINEPLLPDIHPERNLGKLIRLDEIPFQELLMYFNLRRTILLGVLEPLSENQWGRLVREEKKQRKESVFWQARGQALHEYEHLLDLKDQLSRKPIQ